MRRICTPLKTLAALSAAALCAFFFCALMRRPLFEGGYGYELYCGTSSAEIVFTETPALDKLFRLDVRGESARYEGDVSAELMQKFSAKLLFVEEAAGVVNYYLYSEKLPRGVRLNGREVNLHIAVGEGRTAAGTPIIFGGF